MVCRADVLYIMMKKLPFFIGKPLLFVRYSIIIFMTNKKGGYVVAELIAVLSGKGGTGKTSVCAGLAQALAQSGEQVLCIDCDAGLRNLDIALGLSQFSVLSFLDVCQGEHSLDMATRHPLYPSLAFLTAPVTSPAEDVDLDAFGAMLQAARSKFTYVLLDAPAGIDAGFRLAARYADRVLLVTGPDPAAIRDAARAAEELERMGKTNVRLIVNRITKKLASALHLTVDDIMDMSGLPLIGLVPEDKNMMMATAFKQPLLTYTKKGAAAACLRIAKRLMGMKVPVKI